mgnify:CR=1 FL=1
MAGSGELKGLILVTTFLVTVFLVIGYIPGEFYTASEELLSAQVPEYFEGIDIQNYAETYNTSIGTSTAYIEIKFGGHDITIYGQLAGIDMLAFEHVGWWGGFWRYTLGWFDFHIKGIDLKGKRTPEELDSDWDQYANEHGILKYSMYYEGGPKFDLYISFNTTKYSKPSEAWQYNELYILMGIGFDQTVTTMNAWNVISALLFFKMPDIHPLLNLFIALPIWVCIAYLVYVLILKAIPFVGG